MAKRAKVIEVVSDGSEKFLVELIERFSVKRAIEWLRIKFPSFDTSKAEELACDATKNEKEYFVAAELLGYVTRLPEGGGRGATALPAGGTRSVASDDTNKPLLVAAIKMRKDLTERTSRLVQFNYAKKVLQNAIAKGAQVFENATVTNCIPFVEKRAPLENAWISKVDDNRQFERVYSRTIEELMPDAKTLVWKTSNEENILTRYKDFHSLGDYCYISVGMVLNADEKTNKGAFTKDDLISETKDKIHCREYIEAKDIGRYVIKRIRYLEYGTKRCPGQLSRATFPELYSANRILCNGFGSIQATFDADECFLHNHTIYAIVPWLALKGIENKSISGSVTKFSRLDRDEMEKLSSSILHKYLLGILDSRFGTILLNAIRGGDFHILPEHLRNIPIPDADAQQQRQVCDLVDRILVAKKQDPDADTSALESQIDRLVYKLYGLTEEEIDVVEGRSKKEEGRSVEECGGSGAAGVRALPRRRGASGARGAGALPRREVAEVEEELE